LSIFFQSLFIFYLFFYDKKQEEKLGLPKMSTKLIYGYFHGQAEGFPMLPVNQLLKSRKSGNMIY